MNQDYAQPDTTGSPIPEETEQAIRQTKEEAEVDPVAEEKQKKEEKRQLRMDRATRTIRGVGAVAKSGLYTAARGTLKAVPRVAFGVGLGAMAGVIGATLGNGEQAMAMAATGFTGGMSLGGNIFESTAGKVMTDKSMLDAYDTAKYGNTEDARATRADKAYFRSDKFDSRYNKDYKGKTYTDKNGKKQEYTKAYIKDAFTSYRESGVTDEGTIKRSLQLEDEYRKKYKNMKDDEIRANVQNIAQTKGKIDTKAFYDPKFKERELLRLEDSLTNIKNDKQRREVAERIFEGYVDFRKLG